MFEINLMVEGQNGLNWERWKKIALVAEQLGFNGIYRSDHFTNARPPEKDSLELWVSLTWLASHTQRIKFGPLVTPFSFRHPAMTARMAIAVDDLSGGRLVLGLGAGWQEREHTMFGFDLLDIKARFERFKEGVEVVEKLMRNDTPVDYQGKYYSLQQAILLPRPQRRGGPPMLIGGNGRRHTLPLAARYANEWNALFLSVEGFRELNQALDALLDEQSRSREAVRRSMMVGCIYAEERRRLVEMLRARSGRSTDLDAWRAKGYLVGNSSEIRSQLNAYQDAGLQGVMIQWLDLDDLEALQSLAEGIIPR